MGYFGSGQDPVFDGRVFPEQGHSRDDVMELLANFERQDVYAHNTIQSTTLMGHPEAAELARRSLDVQQRYIDATGDIDGVEVFPFDL